MTSSGTGADEFHLHTPINFCAGKSVFTNWGFHGEKCMLGRVGRTSTRKTSSLNWWTLTPVEGCSELSPSFPTALCTILPDKATSSHLSKWDIPLRPSNSLKLLRPSAGNMASVAGWALEHVLWLWLEGGKILVLMEEDKWKRMKLTQSFDKFIKDLSSPCPWTRTNTS